jgi:N4-gp56 family major capsid protein
MRADGNDTGDGTYSFEGTVDSATTTTIVDADVESNSTFGDTNDDLNQSVVIIRTGTGRGQARPVTDFVASGGTITVSPAWDVTPAAGDTFHVVSAHGLTTGTDKLSTTNIRAAVTRLRNNKATPYGGGFYIGILSPDTEAGLMSDTNWTNVMQYRDRPDVKVNGLFAGEVGEWGGVRWIRTTQPFRFPITTVGTAGSSYGVGAFVPGTGYTNYASTGAVYSNLILGKEAFGVTRLSGAGNILKPGIIIKNPGPQDTSNPLNRFSTVGWVLPFVPKALNPLFAVQMWSTPTAY